MYFPVHAGIKHSVTGQRVATCAYHLGVFPVAGQLEFAKHVDIAQASERRVGFTIDEFDVDGNKLSSQQKPGVVNPGATQASFEYTVTSAKVKQARLRVTIPADSAMIVYIDDIRWQMSLPTVSERFHDR